MECRITAVKASSCLQARETTSFFRVLIKLLIFACKIDSCPEGMVLRRQKSVVFLPDFIGRKAWPVGVAIG
jgi:hypothetical protein